MRALCPALALLSACTLGDWRTRGDRALPRKDDTGSVVDDDDTDATETADSADSSADTADSSLPIALYVAVDGDDAADGLSAEHPLRTLDRVQARLFELDPGAEVDVGIAPGTYTCRELTEEWTWHNGHRLRVAPLVDVPSPAEDSRDDANRPVFEGRDEADEPCEGSVWFPVRHGADPMLMTFEGLAITHYRGALSFKGEDEDAAATDQGFEVRNMVFQRIGDRYNFHPHDDGTWLEGKGAILLTDTAGSLFEQNLFDEIRNREGSEGLLHAMYFSSHASRQSVLGNVFHGASGVFVKLTDYSNGNLFLDNRFSYGQMAVRDRWCGALEDPEARCGGEAQCPSWENVFPYESNDWGHLDADEPVRVLDIPEGQTCAHDPPKSNLRMDLGEGGTIWGP